MKAVFFAFVLGLALIPAAQADAPAASNVEIHSAWARATPGGARTAVVYMTLTAKRQGDRLIAASTPVADTAELHSESVSGGVMRMRPLASLEVKPGAETVLKPGGVHIMLVGLKHPLTAGDSFPMTLAFEKSGKQQVTVRVEKVGAMEMHGMDEMPGMTGGGAATAH